MRFFNNKGRVHLVPLTSKAFTSQQLIDPFRSLKTAGPQPTFTGRGGGSKLVKEDFFQMARGEV